MGESKGIDPAGMSTRRHFLWMATGLVVGGLGVTAVNLICRHTLSPTFEKRVDFLGEIRKRYQYLTTFQGRSLIDSIKVSNDLERYRRFLSRNPEILKVMVWDNNKVDQDAGLLNSLFSKIQEIQSGRVDLSPAEPKALETYPNGSASCEAYDGAGALTIYLNHVAHAIYVEVNALVPWSISRYSGEDLSLLFDSHYMFDRDEDGNYRSREYSGKYGHPQGCFSKLRQMGLVKNTPEETLFAITDYLREHTFHAEQDNCSFEYYERAYGARGFPLPEQILEAKWEHPLRGCGEVAHLYRAFLYALNVPVWTGINADRHTYAFFPTIGLILFHADQIFETHGGLPSREIFFSIDELWEEELNPAKEGSTDKSYLSLYRRMIRYPSYKLMNIRAGEILGVDEGLEAFLKRYDIPLSQDEMRLAIDNNDRFLLKFYRDLLRSRVPNEEATGNLEEAAGFFRHWYSRWDEQRELRIKR